MRGLFRWYNGEPQPSDWDMSSPVEAGNKVGAVGDSTGSRFTGKCNFCGLFGHKEVECRKKSSGTPASKGNSEKFQGRRRPLDEVTCFKCGNKGHYANDVSCPRTTVAKVHSVQVNPSLVENEADMFEDIDTALASISDLM